MAAGLGFKDFTTGEVLTAADVDGYLMQGVWVFASAAARDAAVTSPQEGNFAYLKDTNATTYYTGSAWTAIGGGGGKVLQVVQGTTTTSTTVASTTYADTTLTATITPTAATSKILVLFAQHAYAYRATQAVGLGIRLLRGATSIYDIGAPQPISILATGATAVDFETVVNGSYLDSPATTSATTYKTQGKVSSTADSGESIFQQSSGISTITLLEIGA